MPCEVLVRATQGDTYASGEAVAVRPEGSKWGRKEQPPDYVHVTISDADEKEMLFLLSAWELKYKPSSITASRIRLHVDDKCVSKSLEAADTMDVKMSNFLGKLGAKSITYAQSYVEFDLPKEWSTEDMVRAFNDRFSTPYNRRRYYIPSARITGALENQGRITLTKRNVMDKLA